MYTFDFHPKDVSIPFIAFGEGYFNHSKPRYEDPIDVFWELLIKHPYSWYGRGDYSNAGDAVRWLIRRGIHFTVEVICHDELTEYYFIEKVTYRIKIPNDRDAMLFRLSCPC